MVSACTACSWGPVFPRYSVDDSYFHRLRASAEKRDILISSMFSSRASSWDSPTGDPRLEEVTRRGWERLIHVASLVGAQSVGSNAFVLMRDQPHMRETGVRTFLKNIKLLLPIARAAGLKALTTEPMSSIFELPVDPR